MKKAVDFEFTTNPRKKAKAKTAFLGVNGDTARFITKAPRKRHTSKWFGSIYAEWHRWWDDNEQAPKPEWRINTMDHNYILTLEEAEEMREDLRRAIEYCKENP